MSRITRYHFPHSVTEKRRASDGLALGLLGVICFLSWLSASANDGALTGGALTAAGLVMVWHPVRRKIPAICWIAGGLWGLCSALAFLPIEKSAWPEWRLKFAEMGIETGGLFTPQPVAALGAFSVMSAIGIVTLWAANQERGNTKWLSLGFIGAVVLYALLSWKGPSILNFKSNAYGTFGFFPNRNHTATLLVMGSLVSMGLIVQGVRWRSGWLVSIASICLLFLISILFGLNISRAGILLLGVGTLIWTFLSGPRYLSGHVGWVVGLIVIGGVLFFTLLDTRVRQRVDESLEVFSIVGDSNTTTTLIERLESFDLRFAIYRDTIDMVLDAPFTGWGTGQFRFIFPQYQTQTAHLSSNSCLHPESDWLKVAAECGLPAMLALIVLLVGLTAPLFPEIRNGKSRALRAGLLTAAVILPLHGLIDVPGQKFSLLWASAGLLALARSSKERPIFPKASIIVWRTAGVSVTAIGACMIYGQMTGSPIFATDRSEWLYQEALLAYQQDRDNPRQENPGGESPDHDPLEKAIDLLSVAASLTPLESKTLGLRGMLALHFDDKDDLARKSFSMQRVLEPKRISLPLAQAEAWSRINPDETCALWIESLRRAELMQRQFPATNWQKMVHERIENCAEGSKTLLDAGKRAAGAGRDVSNSR